MSLKCTKKVTLGLLDISNYKRYFEIAVTTALWGIKQHISNIIICSDSVIMYYCVISLCEVATSMKNLYKFVTINLLLIFYIVQSRRAPLAISQPIYNYKGM